jgi:hypothetical protein
MAVNTVNSDGSVNYGGVQTASNPSQLSPSAPGYTPANALANSSGGGGGDYGFGAITSQIRAANEARINSLRSQEVGQIQGAQDFGQQSTQFADAQLGRIGGFEGSYRISLQNSIANRTEKNIGTIKRATEEAIQTGNMEMQSRLADLGFQQMKLMADLSQQQLENTRADKLFAYNAGQDVIGNQRADAELELAKEAAKRQGKQFQQLDNGDYGYVDMVTGRFVKQGNAAKPVSRGSGNYDPLSGLPKGFMNAAETGLSQLQKGEEWGPVWNRMKLQFPNVANEMIDKALGGSVGSAGYFEGPTGRTVGAVAPTGFARPGAFEEFKRANLAGTYDNSQTGVDINANINKLTATPEFQNATASQQRAAIQKLGGNPFAYPTSMYITGTEE